MSPRSVADVDVVIVGTGFSGVAMAIALQKAGRSFVMLDKADEFGGVWRANRYPGVACDTPSHLYELKSDPNPYWSHRYATGDEIQDYLLSVVESHHLRPHAVFDAWVTAAGFDPETGLWTIQHVSSDGRSHEVTATALILGLGQLHMPHIPDIPGIHTFAGDVIHTSAWPQGISMHGRRIGVIGTGASAVQVIPPLAEDAEHLTVFQRTPAWVLPRNNSEYSDGTIDRFRRHPRLMDTHRARLRLEQDVKGAAFTSRPRLLEALSKQAIDHARNQIHDQQLRSALTPDYPLGCKGVIRSDLYFPALVREDVSLVVEEIEAVIGDGVVTRDGTLHELDALVLATGFDPDGSYRHLNITGVDGASFPEVWAAGVETYLGMTMAEFPNLFLLLGPNSRPAYASSLFMLEAQVDHIVAVLDERDRRGASSVHVRPELVSAFTRQMQERSAQTVWAAGTCASWYLDESGTNRTLWPQSVHEYEARCRANDFVDYLFD